jgi:group I intron endonuclease
MDSGIYQIRNTENNKKYIGQTKDLEKRKKQHLYNLEHNKHSNIHLQNAFNIYGENSFIFEILKTCEPFLLTFYEQNFVNENFDYLYNIRKECVKSSKGVIFSDNHKMKISKAIMGNKNPFYGKTHTEDIRKKISLSRKGKSLSEETKRKISEANKGKSVSEETRRKLSEASNKKTGNKNSFYGRKHSDETKKKISETKKRKLLSDEGELKMSKTKKGKPNGNFGLRRSEETKKKMSNAQRLRRQLEQQRGEQCQIT